MPAADVDEVEFQFPGFIASRILIASSRIDARLRKRYAVPFVAPVAEIVLEWLTAIVTAEVYRKRGWNPGDAQSAQIEADRDRAFDDLKEAADGHEGLFDIPLREDTTAEGISKGGPLFYSEASPYKWMDEQREAARTDDGG